jgi:hypothetical protein
LYPSRIRSPAQRDADTGNHHQHAGDAESCVVPSVAFDQDLHRNSLEFDLASCGTHAVGAGIQLSGFERGFGRWTGANRKHVNVTMFYGLAAR